MQGISVITDPNGQPAVLTIDLRNLDPAVSPLVTALLGQIEAAPESFDYEHQEFLHASAINLSRAYGDDEPEYDETDLKERNPNYRPQ
ncbi:hypothetical protein GCM10023187_17180 [Nibrella viscosa]|uniref:Uncharacterized protein n=1 Tax=Nibrella viscosa TaxID=1084524 RepID=A0ABP8K8C0_9BACT